MGNTEDNANGGVIQIKNIKSLKALPSIDVASHNADGNPAAISDRYGRSQKVATGES